MGYRRAKERNRRLKKLYDETKKGYGAGAYYNEKKKRYIKCPSSNTPGYTKSLRKISNRRVRKSDIPLKGCSYKKLYDYWWEIIESQKYLYIVFLRIGDAVVISLTKNHDSRIEQLVKNNEEFSVLFSATVSNPLETRRLFWKELKQYMIGNKKEHRYYVQDDILISIINKNNKDLHYPCLGEYVGSVSLKKEK